MEKIVLALTLCFLTTEVFSGEGQHQPSPAESSAPPPLQLFTPFYTAIRNDDHDTFLSLLNAPLSSEKTAKAQGSFHNRRNFIFAVNSGATHICDYYMTGPNAELRPDTSLLNEALYRHMSRSPLIGTLRYLLDPTHPVCPSHETVVAAYWSASLIQRMGRDDAADWNEIVAFLAEHVHPEERLEEGVEEGAQDLFDLFANALGCEMPLPLARAFDVHSYAFDYYRLNSLLEMRCAATPALSLEEALQQVRTWITNQGDLPEQTRELWKQCMVSGYEGIPLDSFPSPNFLVPLVQYVQALDEASKISTWLQGFLGEASTAYDSSNPLSCSRGVRERASLGLRDVVIPDDFQDIGLKALFLVPEIIKRYSGENFAPFAIRAADFLPPNLSEAELAEGVIQDSWLKGVIFSVLESAPALSGEEQEHIRKWLEEKSADWKQHIDWDAIREIYLSQKNQPDSEVP